MSEWVKHDGSKMPVPARTLVFMRFRSGHQTDAAYPADEWHWIWGDSDEGPMASGDIAEYRLKYDS